MYKNIDENVAFLQEKFSDSADFTVRKMILNNKNKTKIAIITIEGMCNKEGIALLITNPLIEKKYDNDDDIFFYIKNSVLSASEVVEAKTFEDVMTYIMSGFAVIGVDGFDKMLAIGIQGFSFRSVSEPESEVVQRGSREGFVEALRINMTLIRRRIKNPDLVFETLTTGDLSKTQICLCYIKSAVSKKILEELKRRLNSTNLSTVLASGYLTDYLEDDSGKSLFTGVGISERPDTVCGKIVEGRIGVIIDGTPSVLTVPFLFIENFQTMDDYSNRPYFTTFIRFLKFISFFVSIYLPSLYLAISNFHPEMFPPKLLEKINDSVSGTPLPLIAEVLVIYFVYEIMREAGLRLPKPLGHAVSIVGGLVIGESAVSAGILGSTTLMVVAVSAICSYVIPNLYPQIMVLRLCFILVGGILGVFGVVLFSCVLLMKLCAKTSFSIPFMSPVSPFYRKSMGDVLIRSSWNKLSKNRITVQSMPGAEDNLYASEMDGSE